MNAAGLGALEFQMLADLAPLKKSMDDAKSLIGGGIESISGTATKLLGGLLAGLSVAAFAGIVKGGIDAAAGLHDLSIQTGASVASLQALGRVGAYTETGMDSITGAMGKLAKNMSLADEEGKGAALAVKALGIDFDDFKQLAPDQQMIAVAKAMGGFADGADKSAAATMLFGKEGAKMLPFLADLGEQADQVNAKLTDQQVALRASQAAMADAFGDNLTTLRKNSDGWKKDLSMGLLPALYEASQAVLSMANGAGGLKAEISKLAADGTLADWARGAMTAFSYLLDVGQGLFTLIPMLGKVIAGVAAGASTMFSGVFTAMAKLKSGDVTGAWDSLKAGFAGVAAVADQAGTDIETIWGQKLLGATFRERMDDLKNVGVQAQETKPKLNLVDVLRANEAAKLAEAAATKAAAEEQRRAVAEYDRAVKAGGELVQSIHTRNAELQLELDMGAKLTPTQKEIIKLTQDLASGKVILTAAEEAAARAAIAFGAGVEQEIVWLREAAKENTAAHEALGKYTDTLRESVAKQVEANAVIGLTARELLAREAAALRDSAAALDNKAAWAADVDFSGQMSAELREQARLLRERADLAERGGVIKEAKAAADEWKKTTDSIGAGLTDVLMRAFESGRGFFSTLWDGIKHLFKTTVLNLMISPVQQGISNMVGAVMGSQASGAGGVGGTGGAGGLAGMYNAGSSIYSGMTGSTMAAGNYAAVYSGQAYGTGFATQQSAMLASQEAGMTSAAGSSVMGSAASYAGWAALIYAASTAAASDYSKGFNAQSAKNTGTAEGYLSGAIADALMSIGIAGEASSILSTSTPYAKLFGMGKVDLRQEGLTGTITQGGVADAAGYQIYHQEGGLFRSDRNWKDATSVGAEMASTLNDQAANVFAAVKKYGDALGLPADQLKNVVASFNVQTIRDSGAVSAEEIKKGLADAFKAYQTALFDSYGPILADLQHAGETVQETLGRLSVVRQFSEDLNGFGGVFSRIANLSMAAKEELIGFAGGMDALMAKTQSFVGSYYSEAEQMGLQARQVQQLLAAAGVDGGGLNNKSEFRALVESQNLGTTEGRKILSELLNIAPAFAALGDYMEKNGGTLGSLAGSAPQSEVLMGLMSSQQVTADAINTTGTNTVAAIVAASTSTVDAVNALTDRINTLEAALTDALARNARTVGDAIIEAQP